MSVKDTGEEKKVGKLNPQDIFLLRLDAAEVKREAELKIVTFGQARLERELGKLSKLRTETDLRLTMELDSLKEHVMIQVEDKDKKLIKLKRQMER